LARTSSRKTRYVSALNFSFSKQWINFAFCISTHPYTLTEFLLLAVGTIGVLPRLDHVAYRVASCLKEASSSNTITAPN